MLNLYSGLLYGKKIFVNHLTVPKMQLSADVPVSDAMREETNRWMVEFFGSRYAIKDDEFLSTEDSFFMNPNAYRMLCKEMPPTYQSPHHAW